MIKLTLSIGHPFFDDFDSMLKEKKIVTGSMTYPDYIKLIKEVYGYDIDVDPAGMFKITMTEQQHLMFLLRYE